MPEIDAILERFAGKRLTQGITVLATIQVETTHAGLRACADSEYVKAVLEDRPISSLLPLKQAR